MRPRSASRWSGSFVICLLGASAFAQQPPRFRTTVDVVVVDVTVVDDNGRPVEGLSAEDFILLVDGERRRVTSISYLSTSDLRPQALPGRPKPASFSTNVGAERGRLVILAVDRSSMRRGQGRTAMASAAGFLDGLAPGDLVGLFTMPPGGPLVDFTREHRRIQEALRSITGLEDRFRSEHKVGLYEALRIDLGDAMMLEEVTNRECYSPIQKEFDQFCVRMIPREAQMLVRDARQQSRDSLSWLSELVEALEPIPGPKTIVLVSGGLFQDGEIRGDVRRAALAAASSRVRLYALQFQGPLMDAAEDRFTPTPLRDLDFRAAGLEGLATRSGGAFFRAAGSGRSAFAHIERELSGHYVLGFEVSATDRDDKPHRIDVELRARRGLVVRAREQFTVPSGPPSRTDADELADILAEPFARTELVLSVATYHVLNPESLEPEVLISSEISGTSFAPSYVSVAALLVEGDDGATRTQFARVTRPMDKGASRPLRHVTSMPLEPGDYTVKIAAIDDMGRKGSVEHRGRFEPHRFHGLELSDLLLVDLSTTPVSPPITSGPSTGNAIGGYLEIYAAREAIEGTSVWFEVASGVDASALVRVPVDVQASQTDRRWVARASIPLQTLPSGSYVARAVLSAPDGLSTYVARDFEFDSTASTSRVEDVDTSWTELLSRVGKYVRDYERALSLVVAEERYFQVVKEGPLAPRSPIPDPSSSAWRGRSARALEHRETLSDVVLVRAEGAANWLHFRDILEVNGRAVRNRERRLEKLFLFPPANPREQLQRIAEESARYNLGSLRRNINVPTLTLLFLLPENQGRFELEKVAETELDGLGAWVFRYRETTSPTFIKTPRGAPLFARGRVWIEPASGAVLRTELVLEGEQDRSTILVSYRRDAGTELWLPAEMRERYGRPGTHRPYVECLALYTNFRTFKVQTTEQVR